MLIYTQMPKLGTNIMLVLGIPFYLWAVFVGLMAASWFPGATLVVLSAAFFLYTFVYSKAPKFFAHRVYPRRPVLHFVTGVLAVQGLLLLGTFSVSRPNNAFKPNPLRYAAQAAGKACHLVHSTARVGLT